MAALDTYLKSVSNFNYEAYIEILYNALLSPMQVKVQSGLTVTIPSMFKFCFDVFDLTEKEFICEHDIFQLI